MSVSVSFQDLLLALLKGSTNVTSIVGARIYDGVPSTAVYPYISIGSSDYTPSDAECIVGREETVQIDCWSQDQGRIWPCKKLVDAVKDAVHEASDDEDMMAASPLASLRVELARAFIERDNITAHGLVQVTGIIEG